MAVLERGEYMTLIKEMLGDDTSDEGLKKLEDLTDTYDRQNDGENWKAKYDQLDEEWRNRYRARFFDGGETIVEGGTVETVVDTPADNDLEPVEHDGQVTYDDLFKEEGEL